MKRKQTGKTYPLLLWATKPLKSKANYALIKIDGHKDNCMKILEKRKTSSGRRHIYFFGIKIFSYSISSKKKKTENIISQLKTLQNDISQLKRLQNEILYIKQWQSSFFKDKPTHFPLILSEEEQTTLIKYLNKSRNYLEFGSGGSTFLALMHSNASVASVESDLEWMDYLRSWNLITKNEQKHKLIFHHVNIGETGRWGKPLDESQKHEYPNYSSSIFNIVDSSTIDTVFIDGRFRVACALAVIKNCSKDIHIIIHDYTLRKTYFILEEFLEPIEVIDTLVIFRIKSKIDMLRLDELYSNYKYIFN